MARKSQSVKRFGVISKKLSLSNRAYRGIHAIKVDQIVGSVGRAQDFLPGFRLKNHDVRYYLDENHGERRKYPSHHCI